MSDQYGNYQPGLQSAAVPATTLPASVLHGSGAPSDSTPTWATGYIDDDTGTIYVKVGGVWQAAVGGSSNPQIITSAVDPTGVTSMTGPGMCFGIGAVAGQTWRKTSAGAATDWEQL